MAEVGSLESQVAVYSQIGLRYPDEPPFHPSEAYPEFLGGRLGPENGAFVAVRELLALLGFDRDRFGTQDWNPMGSVVKPGDLVVIKPNLVRESHLLRPEDWDYIVTHGAVVRALVDYVRLALKGDGRVVITDGPQTDSSFDVICERAGYKALAAHYRGSEGAPVDLMDLRQEEWTSKDGVVVSKKALPGDPMGYTKVELGECSEFIGCPGEGRYYGASYDLADTNAAHLGKRHDYMISSTVLAADVLINVPKLKTHKKAGITCSLKNLVGINGHKNWLPHHTEGTPAEGGDQFATSAAKNVLENRLMGTFKRILKNAPGPVVNSFRIFKRAGRLVFGDTEEVVRSGNWYGNDTIWRMILDLNKAMLYVNQDGTIRKRPRRYFALVDGIMAGEGNGPMAPDRVEAGVLVAGLNPVAVDCASAKLMGLDWRRIPSLSKAFEVQAFPIASFPYSDVVSESNVSRFRGRLEDWDPAAMFAFAPHFGWKGHVELDRRQALQV